MFVGNIVMCKFDDHSSYIHSSVRYTPLMAEDSSLQTPP